MRETRFVPSRTVPGVRANPFPGLETRRKALLLMQSGALRMIRLGLQYSPVKPERRGSRGQDMSQDIVELERRITVALDRIGQGLSELGPQAAPNEIDGSELEALRAALEDERLVTAQLEERIKTLNARLDNRFAEATARVEKQAEAMEKLDTELQRLRGANDQLRASNVALREANEKGVGDAQLINKAMQAELEGLRAARAADAAESAAVLSAMEPLLRDDEGELA